LESNTIILKINYTIGILFIISQWLKIVQNSYLYSYNSNYNSGNLPEGGSGSSKELSEFIINIGIINDFLVEIGDLTENNEMQIIQIKKYINIDILKSYIKQIDSEYLKVINKVDPNYERKLEQSRERIESNFRVLTNRKEKGFNPTLHSNTRKMAFAEKFIKKPESKKSFREDYSNVNKSKEYYILLNIIIKMYILLFLFNVNYLFYRGRIKILY